MRFKGKAYRLGQTTAFVQRCAFGDCVGTAQKQYRRYCNKNMLAVRLTVRRTFGCGSGGE
jgi:hypothetical protein